MTRAKLIGLTTICCISLAAFLILTNNETLSTAVNVESEAPLSNNSLIPQLQEEANDSQGLERLAVSSGTLILKEFNVSLEVPTRFSNFKIETLESFDGITSFPSMAEYEYSTIYFDDSVTGETLSFGTVGQKYERATDCGKFSCVDFERLESLCSESDECTIEYITSSNGYVIQKQTIGSDAQSRMGGFIPDTVFYRIDLMSEIIEPLVFFHPDVDNISLTVALQQMVMSTSKLE